jgi:ADP-heptose:LPS heptosyltransferase
VISRWTGAPYRLGFHRADCKEFNWLFNNHSIPAVGDQVPKIQHYMKFAEHLGIAAQKMKWDIDLTPQDKLNVEKYLQEIHGDFAVLFAGARWESKQWFPSQIAACARMMQRRYDLKVIVLGSHDDRAAAVEAEDAAAGIIHNWVGRTTLREAAGIIARARVCVGPDTGLMHLAAAVGTPVVSLWGATNPTRTGPYGCEDLVIKGQAPCSPCYRAHCPIGRVCMQSIGTEEIQGTVAKALIRGQAIQARNGSLHAI